MKTMAPDRGYRNGAGYGVRQGGGWGQNIPPRLKTGRGMGQHTPALSPAKKIYIYIYIYTNTHKTTLNFLKLLLHIICRLSHGLDLPSSLFCILIHVLLSSAVESFLGFLLYHSYLDRLMKHAW